MLIYRSRSPKRVCKEWQVTKDLLNQVVPQKESLSTLLNTSSREVENQRSRKLKRVRQKGSLLSTSLIM